MRKKKYEVFSDFGYANPQWVSAMSRPTLPY